MRNTKKIGNSSSSSNNNNNSYNNDLSSTTFILKNKTKQNKTKQKQKQNTTERNETKRNETKTKQNKTTAPFSNSWTIFFIFSVPIIPDFLIHECKVDKCLKEGHILENDKCNYDITVPPLSLFNATNKNLWTQIEPYTPKDVLPDVNVTIVTVGPTPDPEEICYSRVSGKIGMLFASKFLLRIVFSPIAGFLTIR